MLAIIALYAIECADPNKAKCILLHVRDLIRDEPVHDANMGKYILLRLLGRGSHSEARKQK